VKEKKTILLVCAAGFATTSMLKMRIEDGLDKRSIDIDMVDIQTATISNIKNYIDRADLIVTTLSLDESDYSVPIINGTLLLAGMKADVLDRIVECLSLSS
jgi:galactitol-specific phosphotransferase system IIB component